MKKIISILGIMIIAMLIFTIPCLAETTVSITDSFDDYTTDTTLNWKGYESPLFKREACDNAEILATGGRDGKAILQYVTNVSRGDSTRLRTVEVDTISTDTLLAKIDFRITGIGNMPQVFVKESTASNEVRDKRIDLATCGDYSTSSMMKIGYREASGSSPAGMYFETVDGTVIDECVLNEWYHMIIVQEPTKKTIVITDMLGDVVATNTADIAIVTPKTSEFFVILARAFAKSNTIGMTEGITIQFDNAELVKYASTSVPELVTQSVTTGDEELPRNQKLSFNFDHVISGTVTLKKGETPVEGATTKIIGLTTAEVVLPSLLDKGETYTVSFENIKNSGNTSTNATAITFSTEKMHILNDVADVTLSAGTGGKTRIGFKISDPYGYATFSGAVLVARYDVNKQMLGLDMIMLTNESVSGVIEKEFALGTVATGDNVSVMVFDSASGLVPLSSGNCTVE